MLDAALMFMTSSVLNYALVGSVPKPSGNRGGPYACYGCFEASDGLLALAQHGEPEPINIGTGQAVSVAALAQAVASATGFSGTIRFDSSKPDGQPRKVMDCSLAAERLGWRAETDLETGLAQTVAWYREQLGC